ncbi:unnamed protein product [Blepharisma stoltei]|uniref:Uncharacterized protein n=1 Tax=Blepharisma stoltei TaxID=1481888 RepID=A0AAU9K1Q1_9CILI|nr:unnamed protein product [Blepharisma stoltei]
MKPSLSQTNDYNFKIIIVGDSGVGKSSLIRRYMKKEFSEKTATTIGVWNYTKIVEIENKNIMLNIWDTAGQEKFKCLIPTFFRGSHAAILVYDITNQKSFNSIFYWIDKIHEHATSNVVFMMIGNKSDMETERKVPQELGQSKARDNKMLFLETSCLNSTNVERAFEEVTNQLLVVNGNQRIEEVKTSELIPSAKKISIVQQPQEVKKRKRRRC